MKEDLSLWVEVDLGRVKRNVERLKAMLTPPARLLAVVKANGYGHGDAEVARAAVEGGADWLGVARVEEGASLRAAGISNPILLLAEPPVGGLQRAVELGLTLTVYTAEVASALSEVASSARNRVEVHMKVDTGMHRYGVSVEEAPAFLDGLRSLPGLQVSGIWTHFAVAEDVMNPFTKEQYIRFTGLLDDLGPSAEGLLRHMANSAATITFPESHMDLVRAGIAIYGIHPSPPLADAVPLEPAMEFHARVGMTKRLGQGEAISYGQRYHLERDGTVATVPCGYADGLDRGLTNQGLVLIGGKRYRISGTITMDHFLIDIGDDEVSVGDEVVMMGSQGDEEITAQEIASALDTIPYEIVCGVSARVPRLYKW